VKTWNLNIDIEMDDDTDEEELLYEIERLLLSAKGVTDTYSHDWAPTVSDTLTKVVARLNSLNSLNSLSSAPTTEDLGRKRSATGPVPSAS
jgi:hypothetical protein